MTEREHPEPEARRPLVTVWPHLLARELLASLALLLALAVMSLAIDAPLEQAADPARTPDPARAPWYFAGLQELLHYVDPWIAGVMIPLVIVIGLCAIPYLDPGRTDEGVYTVRRRPLASAIWIAGVAGWFALIVVGTWWRGPGWSWIGPFAAASREAAAPARSLPNAIGVPLLLAYFLGGGALILRRTRGWPSFGRWRRFTFAFLLLAMAGTLLRIGLRLAFGITHLARFDGVNLTL